MNNWFYDFFNDWKGNIERIHRIRKHHYGWFVDHANGIVHDEEKAKDVVNKVFSTAYQRHNEFKSATGIFRFLFFTIRENCCAVLTERDQENQQERRKDDKIKEVILSRGNEEYIITKEVRLAVEEEIQALSQKRKQVISLFLHGLKASEVAYMVDRKITTVRNLRNKASIVLFNALQKRGVLISQNSKPGNSSGFNSEPES
jgi:DNA-directed RNA polymerase specialized sigma24 family protein